MNNKAFVLLGVLLGLPPMQAWSAGPTETEPYAWYRADQGIEYTQIEGVVTLWKDQSGNGRDLGIIGSPRMNAEGLIETDQGVLFSPSSLWGTVSPGTVFAVWSCDADPPGSSFVYHDQASGPNQHLGNEDPGDNQGSSYGDVSSWGGSIYGYNFPREAENSLKISVASYTGGGPTGDFLTIRDVQGNLLVSETGNCLSSGMDGFVIGGAESGGNMYHNLEGVVAEVIVYEGDLSSGEINQIEDTLRARWSVPHTPPVITRDVGSRKQLFIDDYVVAEIQGVQRQFMKPTKSASNPILVRDKPWDAGRCDIYGSAVHDPDHDRLQVFYAAVSTGEGHDDRLAYAESYDGGATWTKPELDLIPFEDHDHTNLVALPPSGVMHGPCVFRDEHETDPAKRYKLFTSSYPDSAYLGLPSFYYQEGPFLYADPSVPMPEGIGEPGMYVGYSPDGIHWTLAEEPFSNLMSDTAQSVMWDERIGKYVAYVRARTATGRSVARMESEDFENWTEPEVIMTASDHQIYSMGVTPYEGIYLGTPWMCWDLGGTSGSVISPELAISRDGIHWTRPNQGEEFIPTGPPGSADDLQIRMASSMVVLEDEILFVYGQTDQPHIGDMQVEVGMATLRLDGFAAMTAEDDLGLLKTVPLTFSGNQLCLNIKTEQDGFVSVQVLQEDGETILGTSLPVSGDDLSRELVWRDDFDLAEMAGTPVILRFAMRDAELYAFQFTTALPGDLNGDGFVGGDDLDRVRANWGQSVDPGDLVAGDPSGDGFVGGDDLDIIRSHWGDTLAGPPATPVPEPDFCLHLAIMGIGAAVLMLGRGEKVTGTFCRQRPFGCFAQKVPVTFSPGTPRTID